MRSVFLSGLIGLAVSMVFACSPSMVFAEDPSTSTEEACNASFFMMPAWYNGMASGDDCEFQPIDNDIAKTGAKIGANILQAALVLVAYVTIFFLIRGGFAYMTSTGSPDGMASAKKTIMNALIGMVIAILAASIVNAIGAAIK